jgi:glycosyltransferase involved in cell wall biosynthesis
MSSDAVPYRKIQYVTAFYSMEGRDYQNADQVLIDFKPFLQTTMPILIFTDVETLGADLLLDSTSHIQVKVVPKSELVAFQQTEEHTILPVNRNKEKDTLAFLQLMNAKPEFLKRASDLVEASTYVWFDFGILKISKYRDVFLQKLENLTDTVTHIPNKIIIPGCKSKESIDRNTVYSNILWRFCGGVVVVPQTLVHTFFTLTKAELDLCIESKCMTWEVNIWTLVEQKAPELFHWYLADHNDSMVAFPLPPKQKRVILLSMIKNESRIIKRCIESTLSIADGICICDTGSTDNTVELLTEYLKTTLSIPGRIYTGDTHLWKNFGYNRSQSFLAAVDYCKSLGWDPEHTYALVLDADMELKVMPNFDKNSLASIGYKMIQKSHSLEYYNTRFMKLSHPWSCVGVTHEYWDGGNTDTLNMDQIYISDIGDGGCKADKFERDVRLLEQGLIDSPNNPRYLFYLAQSYKDNQQIDKSIELYKRRIDAGGWGEEVWYSMYMIMKLYSQKKQFIDMEYWGLKAYEYRKERSENLLFLVRHFRDHRQYYKAWHYYQLGSVIPKPNDLLFIETDVYERLFDYERCIIHDYVFQDQKQKSMEYSLNYFNKYHDQCMYNNIEWFVCRIPSSVKRPLYFQQLGDYVPTSTCFCKQPDGLYRVNVRYVNYRIQHNGSYLMSVNGRLDGGNPVRTKNYTCLMDAGWNFLSTLEEMVVTDRSPRQSNIEGLEDVRIFYKGSELMYTATTKEYSYDGHIRQYMGIYDIAKKTLRNGVSLQPPYPTDCEKNWIPYKETKFIYGWHPFQIGALDSTNKLIIEVKQDTPKFLSHMRGSSTLVEEGGYLWGITHCVIYKSPRKYYHMVVKIDPKTDRLVGYSDPFFFVNNAIEYCLGFEKRGSEYTVIVSQNDCNPVMITFKNDDLRWKSI